MSFFRVVIVGMVLTTLCWRSVGEGLAAQASSPPWADPMQATSQATDHGAEIQRSRISNADRRKQLIANSNKLIALSATLKQQIDQTRPGTLSADAIKTAGEIEKLAHSVQQGLRQ
jgi:hypothetical protein